MNTQALTFPQAVKIINDALVSYAFKPMSTEKVLTIFGLEGTNGQISDTPAALKGYVSDYVSEMQSNQDWLKNDGSDIEGILFDYEANGGY